MQEMQFQSLIQEDPLEEGMVTHSSILTRKIPWSEGSVGLRSMGSQTVKHNWNNWTQEHDINHTLIVDHEKISISLEKQSFNITFMKCQPCCSACLAYRKQYDSYSHNHRNTK